MSVSTLDEWLSPSVRDAPTRALLRWLDARPSDEHRIDFRGRLDSALVWLALARALSERGGAVRVAAAQFVFRTEGGASVGADCRLPIVKCNCRNCCNCNSCNCCNCNCCN
jgi:hypothetical protein